ncbi:MAG: pilus assembly protein PilP, partial [Chthoniobacterales bacterium]
RAQEGEAETAAANMAAKAAAPAAGQAAPPAGTPNPPAAPVAGQAPATGQAVPPAGQAVAKPGAAAAAAAKAAAGAGAGSQISELEGFLEPFIYDVVNRRDPFLAYAEYVPVDTSAPTRPLSPAQRFDLDQLRLVGIMWDIRDPKAMFMDPEAEVIVLGRDEGIGNRNGYIASIREGEVVVVEAIRKRGDIIYKTRVLRIER